MSQQRYFDPWTQHTHLTFTVKKFYESFETPYQKIEVFEAEDFGTVLALGGVTNVTDRDESGYHEMLAHAPLLAHPNPRQVLIIGGGDGGTLREVLRHPEVERAVLVDIDGEVIRVARQYFPQCAKALDDPRTDPVDAAVELFTEKFYRHCATLLGDQGILVPQSDSPTFYLGRVAEVFHKLNDIFTHTSLYLGQVTAYPGGVWAYTAASQTIDVKNSIRHTDRSKRLDTQLRYANLDFIRAAFALPTYVQKALHGGERHELPSLGDDPTEFGV